MAHRIVLPDSVRSYTFRKAPTPSVPRRKELKKDADEAYRARRMERLGIHPVQDDLISNVEVDEDNSEDEEVEIEEVDEIKIMPDTRAIDSLNSQTVTLKAPAKGKPRAKRSGFSVGTVVSKGPHEDYF